MRTIGVVLTCLLLAGCGGDSSVTSAAKGGVKGKPKPAPTAAPAPTPSPSPSPSPSPTPAPSSALDDGKTVIVAEGDSISVDYTGYYTGFFRYQHPGVEYHVLAVGGSGITNLVSRRDQVNALNPDFFTVFIGANDLGAYATAQAFVNDILAYVAPIRERGTKVLVATPLPRMVPSEVAYSNNHNLLRDQVSVLLKAEVGKTIDGVIDFGGHPVMGQLTAANNLQLYKDGLHPTDRGWNGVIGGGGHDYLSEVYRATLEPMLP